MVATIGGLLVKAMLDMALKLFTEEFIQELLVYVMSKLAGMTKTNVDDELVAAMKAKLYPAAAKPEDSLVK